MLLPDWREMNPLDRLLAVGTDGHAVEKKRARVKHPAGWTPGVQLSSVGGSVVTEPLAEVPQDWNHILTDLLPAGYNVEDYEVEGDSVEVRAWDSGDQRLYYFKARIRKRGVLAAEVDLEDIISRASSVFSSKDKKAKGLVERCYFFQITDLQSGQADGYGVEGMVAKALELSSLALIDLDTLEAAGKPATQIFIPITGDLVEGIVGWYEMQTFSVALDRREQVKLVRRLLSEFLCQIAAYGLPVHVAVVPGNHGENRANGKAFTTLGDNDDVAVVEQIAEAFQLAGLDSVTFSFPARERLSLTVEVLGHIVGLTHGHIARGGTGTESKILNWFKSMAATRDPVGDSDLLFTGHYHHFRAQQLVGDTWWIQGGALCDTSAWFSQSSGLVSDPVVAKGTITRDKVIESLMPHYWERTKVESVELK